jgi:hypothetical protein
MKLPTPVQGEFASRRLLALLGMMLAAGLAFAQPAGPTGTIRGVARDSSGSVISGAVVTLDAAASARQRTALTDDAGSFYFSAVEPGTYALTITATAFSPWKSANVVVSPGENQPLMPAVLQIAPTSSNIEVTLSPHDLATEQVKAEEKQRVLGLFPNYFVTYDPNAAPLTAAQKFHLGWKTLIDPVVILDTGLGAGFQQARNHYPEFGQGMEGFGKRFGALYANRVSGVLIGRSLTHVVFHQDPRYFYKGTGSFRSRALYAIGTAFVAKGDNGRWQPDYSDVVGGVASSEIATLYYPASSRTGLRIFHNVLLGFAGRAGHNLVEEFVFRKVSTHVPKMTAVSLPVLPEGTPVALISVQDLNSKTAGDSGPIAFTLASDLPLGGVVIAEAGSRATGQVTYSKGPANGEAIHISLDRVRLKVGNLEVPLRSTQLRTDAGGGLEYHRLEDSGRVAIVLYVAANIPLPEQ